MIKKFSYARGLLATAPRTLGRSAVFSVGLVAGVAASTVAGYGIVTVLFPATPEPAPIVAEAPAAIALPDDGMRLAAMPAPSLSRFSPPNTVSLPGAARIAVGGGQAPALVNPTLAVQSTAAPAVPAIRPVPRPEGLALASAAPVGIPQIAPLRPRPRPEGLTLAVAQVPLAGADILSIRPTPRPDDIVLASSKTPSPARSTAARPLGGDAACGRSLSRAMPARKSGAVSGTDFFANLGGLSGSERDARVINELARGNMPSFLRNLEAVSFRGKDAKGAAAEIVICVTPDYLALGSDRDYVRVPLGLPAAARIAAQFDMTLPTPRMVDAIYAQADVRLSPSPMTPGPQMSSTAYLLRHNATIEGQLRGRGGLVAGQKKDVVMASRMASNPGRVAIYGWHRSSGKPIQPVSTVHGANYADYSHGIRLVSKTAYLNGRAVSLDELLASPRYAALINTGGPLPGPVIRIASR